MCGGASKIMTWDLNIPDDLKNRLVANGLETVQHILDEGKNSLVTIGVLEADILGLSEAVHQETGYWVD